jgi:conjugal transfer pilus assembly protein TraB
MKKELLMSWQNLSPKRLFSGVSSFTKARLKPESERNVKRLQNFWMICVIFAALTLSYGMVFFLFEKQPVQKQAETLKPVPTQIETASHKVDLNEVRWHRVEEETKKLSDDLTELKKFFQPRASLAENSLNENPLNGNPLNGTSETQELANNPPSYSPEIQALETKILQLENQVVNQNESTSPPYSQNQKSEQEGSLIQKFSLVLVENPKHMRSKTVDTTIPAGAFAKTVLLSGLDASSAMTASSDPRPMLLRLIDPGTLPRRFQSDLKDCHCTASAYGDLSSERVYARLEKLTCIERKSGEIIETQVAGYIAGSDGKAGIRGIVVSKDGQFLIRSLVGGMFAGLSNVANPQNRQAQLSPFAPGSAQVSPPNVGEMFTSGMATGATSALDRLSQYYIDRAEQLQPVIQVAAGQVVDIVFTEGTSIGAQSVQSEIEKTREESHVHSPTGKENL